MMIIDTYKAMQTLTSGKAFTKAQAEKLLEVTKESNENIATKSDIKLVRKDIDLVRSDLTGEINSLRNDLTGDINSLRSDLTGDINSLRKDMESMGKDLTVRLYGSIITLGVFIVATLKYL